MAGPAGSLRTVFMYSRAAQNIYTDRYIPFRMPQNIKIPTCKCERCGYTWYLRYPQKPRVCPSCKSPYWEASSEFVNDLRIDAEKAEKIIAKMAKRLEDAEKNPVTWASIIKEGWQRMLETSELPIANVDKVYAGGFSVQDWFMNTYKISEGLAENVASHFAGVGERTVTVEDNIVRRAEEVLDWKEIMSALDQDTVKVLALVWLADKFSTEVMLPETEMNIEQSTWQLIEGSLCKKRLDLIRHVEEAIEIIGSRNKGATSWAEVIRFA